MEYGNDNVEIKICLGVLYFEIYCKFQGLVSYILNLGVL